MSLDLPKPPTWMDDAACRWTPYPDAFFPDSTVAHVATKEAIKVCKTCPVAAICHQPDCSGIMLSVTGHDPGFQVGESFPLELDT